MTMGHDKVVVSVLTSMDFTKEKREEKLVEPVNTKTGEGIDLSVERIVETYNSEGAVLEDASGTGESEIANYEAADGGGTSESERTEERINREVNRINKQIEMSPYVIDDITINVGVEPPVPDNPGSLSPENVADIRNLLSNTVATTLSMNGDDIAPEDLDNRISVFATEFKGKQPIEETEPIQNWWTIVPAWLMWVIGGSLAALLIGIFIFALTRRRKREEYEEEIDFGMFEKPLDGARINEIEEIDLAELTSKSNPKRKTIEKLAKERPEDFAKLLRTWMADE
ncbi:flagellar M-ring protein FliF C-terminal domain-containing protein [Planococcus koreensis]|uniref:flagellar M-ring protein FliF C-terminal domain-containing protein n=1 Tax=Planococcus koreensis TaxID=112331 RepID=UPI0039FBF5AF